MTPISMERFEPEAEERAARYRVRALRALKVAAETREGARRREFLRLAHNWHVLALRLEQQLAVASEADRARAAAAGT